MTQQEYNARLFQLTHAYKVARRNHDRQAVGSALAAVSAHGAAKNRKRTIARS